MGWCMGERDGRMERHADVPERVFALVRVLHVIYT